MSGILQAGNKGNYPKDLSAYLPLRRGVPTYLTHTPFGLGDVAYILNGSVYPMEQHFAPLQRSTTFDSNRSERLNVRHIHDLPQLADEWHQSREQGVVLSQRRNMVIICGIESDATVRSVGVTDALYRAREDEYHALDDESKKAYANLEDYMHKTYITKTRTFVHYYKICDREHLGQLLAQRLTAVAVRALDSMHKSDVPSYLKEETFEPVNELMCYILKQCSDARYALASTMDFYALFDGIDVPTTIQEARSSLDRLKPEVRLIGNTKVAALEFSCEAIEQESAKHRQSISEKDGVPWQGDYGATTSRTHLLE